MNTKYESLKNRLIEIYTTLLNEYEEDIQSGIEQRVFKEEDNQENLVFISEARELIKDFQCYMPAIYTYVKGGVLQGISATESMYVNTFDHDNYDADEDSQDYTPKEWDQMIQKATNKLEIKGIF